MKRLLKFLFVIAAVFFVVPLVAASDPVTGTAIALFSVLVIGNLVIKYIPSGILGVNSMDQRMIFDNARQAITKAYGVEAVKKFVLSSLKRF